ncbi:MAG: rane fusion protein multidrug efflux system [Pyrinomonadaceae bacterium]|jgi:membrane fusion protein (multidrug efflux system)|nr:rane fusion protein multidrug efflux system [Pyrinomonadaceae bacterium]
MSDDVKGTSTRQDEFSPDNEPVVSEFSPAGSGTDAGETEAAQSNRKQPLYRRPAFVVAAAVVLILAVVFGLRYWLYARSHESTDDAFISGHIVAVSPKASGYVAQVYVKENQEVKAGDLIAELDARDYEVKLDQARAALQAGTARLREARTGVDLTRATARANVQQASATVQQARSGVESQRAAAAAERARTTQAGAGVATAQANVAQARSQVASADAEAARAKADVERYQQLFQKDETSRQRLDQAIASERTAAAQLDAARQRVAAAEAQVNEARAGQLSAAETARRAQSQVGGAQAGVTEAFGRLAQANTAPQQVAVSQAQAETAGASLEQLQAAVKQAELDLSYTKIYAPETGRVTRKAIEPGALVQIGQPLMAIVSGEVWVIANFKESQIGNLRVGQSVELNVDAYPDKVFKGHVDSIQAGTGSAFSLIPAENATGNYVKVVQRVPVKLVFDEQPDPGHLLAPGMSVEPEVRIK